MTTPFSSTQGTPTETSSVDRTVRLSNERTLTTWANPLQEVSIRAHPTPSSRAIARTRLETADGFPEVYLLLSSLTDAHGRVWVDIRVPGRPNGRTGWVPRSALAEFNATHWLIDIRLRTRRLTVYYRGKLRFSAPVGVGKPSTPTPTGHFWIRERIKLSSPSNPYWPYALGTSGYSEQLTEWPGGGVVGIHGAFGAPQLIPGDPSHGCVRMHDASALSSRVRSWMAGTGDSSIRGFRLGATLAALGRPCTSPPPPGASTARSARCRGSSPRSARRSR